MKVCLVVRVIDENEYMLAGYTRSIELPFVPTLGLKFKQGSGTTMWDTELGELSPVIKEVVYNLDEETVYCLFEINESLQSSFWTEIPTDVLEDSFELNQFGTIPN